MSSAIARDWFAAKRLHRWRREKGKEKEEGGGGFGGGVVRARKGDRRRRTLDYSCAELFFSYHGTLFLICNLQLVVEK